MPEGILKALKQYIADALPGGKLNRELTLDVNESPVPRAVAALRAFAGTAPEDLGISVMNEDARGIRAAAEPAYWASLASGVVPALSLLKRAAFAKRLQEASVPVKEQKMLQGIYRGYSGDDPDRGIFGSVAQRYYGSPQRKVAEIYANRYAKMHDADPHVEMLLVDPFKGARYPHIPTVTRHDPTTFTMARELAPEEILGRTQLYARGGLAQLKECSCHG